MKLFRLAVLFLITVALLAGTPAFAAKPRSTNLTCVVADPTDPDYGASGVAKLTVEWSYFETMLGTWQEGSLSVSCRGLTPGVTYTVFWPDGAASAFTPKRGGNASIERWVGFWNIKEVWVVREDGTLVLEGIVP